MKKLLSLFPFLVLFLFSCANFQNTNSISVSINGRDLARSAARDVAPISDESGYFVTAAIRGDFNQSQTAFINPSDECVFVFDYVPLNSEVYAEINVFQRVGPNASYEPSIQIYNGKSETITVSPGENYLPLALNFFGTEYSPAFEPESGPSALIKLYQNGKYYIQLNDGGVISEGLWRCSEAFGAELGPFGLEQSFTLYLTEYVYGKIKEQYSTTPVIIELPEEKAVNVKYDGNSHRFSFEGKSGYNFVVGEENNDDPPPQTYNVNIQAIIQNGSVTSDHTNPVEPGTTVTITVTPNPGYKILNLLIDNQPVSLSEIVANQYAFKMPEDNVSVSAAFEPIPIPAGFVLVQGQNVNGSTYGNTPASNVFVNGRTVTINDFYMCEHEVTKKEYETYCRYSGTSVSGNDDKAVYYVSWYDAIVYCNLRSLAEERTPVYSLYGNTDPKQWEGKQVTDTKYCGPASENADWNGISCNFNANGYRLPTEAEWEYAARGGKTDAPYTYSGANEAESVAFYDGSYPDEVMGKAPNDLNLYDMSGNAREWCWDKSTSASNTALAQTTPADGPSSGNYRVFRGGGAGTTDEDKLSVNYRAAESPYRTYSNTGFRVVRNAD